MIRRLALAIALIVLPTAVPATAAPMLKATIVELTPALPTSDITVNLQLENPGTVDIANLRVQFFISTAPLVGRSQIALISKGKSLPTYRVLPDSVASGLVLSSGASTTIPLTVSTRALGLASARPGVYTFGVIVDADGITSVRALTFLPWLRNTGTARALGVVPVISLSAPPQRAVDGTFTSPDLANAIRIGGRLRSQLNAMLLVRNATWLVDPVTLEAVKALSEGARISDDGDVRAASNDEMSAAAQWLADLRVVANRGQLYAMPAGDMDIRAALKFGHNVLVDDAISTAATRVATVLQLNAIGTAVQIYDGSVSDSTWRRLRELGVDLVLVSDTAYPAQQKQYTPASSMSVPAFSNQSVLVVDRASGDVLTGNRNDYLLRQEFAAQLAMTYLEQPNKQRVVTVAIPQTWRPDEVAQVSGLFNERWLDLLTVSAATAIRGEPRKTVVSKPTKRQRQQELTLSRALFRQRLLQRLTTDEAFRTGVSNVVSGLSSRWFTGDLIDDTYTRTASTELAALTKSVRVVTRGDIVFGSEQGVVPVTIANGLPVPVDIVLHASGLPSVRVEPEPETPLHLNAGKRVSVEIPTRVTGSGIAYLQLWLESSGGTLIGDAVILDIRSAAYARVAGYLVAAAFVTLLLLIAVNTVRRVRVRRTGSGRAE